jgi:hypothetical protein
MRMRIGLWAVLVLAGSTAAGADEAAGVAAGDKVRLTPADGRRFSAVVVETEPDALVVRTGPQAAPTRVPLAGLQRVQVARGRRGHVKEGALIGFVPGFLFGAVIGHVLGCDDQGPNCSGATRATLAAGTMVGGITAAAGGLVGLAVRTDRWVDAAPSPPRVQGVILPLPGGGAAASVAVSF